MLSGRARGSFFVAAGLLFAAGCTGVISSEMRHQSREDLTFPMVLQNPTAYIGETVILGGVIIQTINRQEGTEIVVLETPLDYQEMPRDAEYSRGRFIGRVSGYLDPEVYKQGKKITLAGEIIGKETRPLGQIQYAYPLIQIRELHLWTEVVRYSPYGPYYWGWYWYPPSYFWPYYRFHYPYW
jgi:outer membrane lipoprotein